MESASKITVPIALLMALGASAGQMETMVIVTLLVSGLSSLTVSSRIPVLGFGRLLPAAILSSFVSASMMAARAGGLPLVAGMTLITGGVVCLLSRLLHRWRFLFPPEVVGLIAFMVGASQTSLAVTRFLGTSRGDQAPPATHLLIASGTLALLAALTVWGKGKLRLFSSLLTLIAGYTVSAATGMIKPELWQRVLDASWIGLPHISPPGFAFDIKLIPPFCMLALSAALKASGDLTVCEKISDADWKRTDLKTGASALFTFGLGSMLSAAFGGFALMSSSSNVGLSAATGAVSRVIGYACGGWLIALVFFPKVVALIVAAPAPVVGAMLLLVVSYNLIAGMQIIMSRMMEARHTYIIGLSLLFGLSADAIPGAYTNLPEWLRPVFSSGLTLATVLVVMLNLLFRIGTSRRHHLELQPGGEDVDKIYEFLENYGAEWGARREVIERAIGALVELYESLAVAELARSPIRVEADYNEFRLDFTARYQGLLPEEQPKKLDLTALMETDGPMPIRISGMLLHRLADRVRTKSYLGSSEIELHFEH